MRLRDGFTYRRRGHRAAGPAGGPQGAGGIQPMTTDDVRSPPIAVDDLVEPRFDDATRSVLDLLSKAGAVVSLDPGSLADQACAETGLDGFGPEGHTSRLEPPYRALREQAGLSDAGVLTQSLFLTGLLKNCLLIQDLLTRHPEIRDEEVAAPIIICGLPRTGLGLDFLNSALPEFRWMHQMTVHHAHEEIQLVAIDISTMLFETIAPIPSWRDVYLSRDQRPSYEYLKTVLQVLQWSRGGTRWVLKSSQHLEQFPALLATFPDATFVVTHRDPVSVTVSMVTMLAYSARLADDLALVRLVHALAGLPPSASATASMLAFLTAHPRSRPNGVVYDPTPFGLDRADRREAVALYTDRFGVRPVA